MKTIQIIILPFIIIGIALLFTQKFWVDNLVNFILQHEVNNQISSTQNNIKNQAADVKSNNYNIFGGSKFDSRVDGYLEIKQAEIFDSTTSAAYFVITKFYDDGFRNSIEKGISEGNTVNLKEGGVYKFNLGCFKDGKIEGIKYESDIIYIDDKTQEKIINSSSKNPISITLSFGYHSGTGCTCCNLAHSIKVVD